MAGRAGTRVGALVVGLVAALAMAMGIAPRDALAQATNAIHLEIADGPSAGAYDLVTAEPCFEGDNGPGIWAISVDDPAGTPSRVSLMFAIEPGWNQISAQFGDPAAGGPWYRSDYRDQGRATIDDRGDAVTLTLAIDEVHVYDDAAGREIDVPAQVTVECHVLSRRNPAPSHGGLQTPPEPGRWTGTITVSALVDHHESESGSDQDAGSTYHATWVRDEVVQTQVTDTYAIEATDPADTTYGIRRVELGGSAANAGSTLERSVTTWQKQNSGCTWTEELRVETEGPWESAGGASGELVFDEGGGYQLRIAPETTGPNGESAEPPQLPHRDATIISDLSAGCEGQGWDLPSTMPPLIWWASQLLTEYDVDGAQPQLTGTLDATDPGAVVSGSGTWQMSHPEDTTLSVEWQLAREGPIVLPHS
ncbi:MAG: hypothetical protein U0667_05105 [Chloroflexota bacterium]